MDPYELFLEDKDVYEEYLRFDLDDIRTRSYMEYILDRWDKTNAQLYDKYMHCRSGDYRTLKYLKGKYNNITSNDSITLDWYSDEELAKICMANKNYIIRALEAKRYNAIDILASYPYLQLGINDEMDLYLIRRQRLPILNSDIVMKYPLESYISDKSSFVGLKFYPSTKNILQLYSIKDYDHSFNILDYVDMSLYDDDFYCGDDSTEAYAMLGLNKNYIISPHNKIGIIKHIPDGTLIGNIRMDVSKCPKLLNWIHKYNDDCILTASLNDTMYMQYIRDNALYDKTTVYYSDNVVTIGSKHKLHNITVVVRDLRTISDYDYLTLIRSGITSIIADIGAEYNMESLLRFMEYHPITSINNIREIKCTTIGISSLNYRIGMRNILKTLSFSSHSLINYALKHYPNVIPDDIYIKYSKFIKKKKKIHNIAFSDICIEFIHNYE